MKLFRLYSVTHKLDFFYLFYLNLINNRDLQDGLVLLQLQDQVKPGCVVWKEVNRPPYKMAGLILFNSLYMYIKYCIFI